jgi:hypothetical protein
MMQLTDKAMLVRVAVTQWTARKHDKNISAEIAESHGATIDAGRYNKALIAKEALATILSAANAARGFHYVNSLPWQDDGYRILPAANYLTYTREMSGLRDRFDAAVRAFLANYESYVDDARRRLNGMFKDTDYPVAAEIARKFTFDVGIMPMPDAADFRVNVAADELSRIKADIETRTNAAVAGAVRDLWQRIHDCVAHISERLGAYKIGADDKVSNPFRDSLVGNMRDLVELLPRLNVTGDADLAGMTDRLQATLCRYDADTLRNSPVAQEETKAAADKILADMEAFMGR